MNHGKPVSLPIRLMRESDWGPSTCPWCGLSKKVFVRAGSELVCTDCVEKDAAMDATWMDGLPREGEE